MSQGKFLTAAVVALAVSAAVVTGCGSSGGGSPAQLPGSYGLVQAGNLVFVTASDLDVLRVLDVAPPATTGSLRQWVRAPNPLFALGINVLPRPTALAQDRDVTWKAGNWVFATSAGSAAISIVAVDALAEVKRLPTAAPVSAVTAFSSATRTTVFFATFDGDTGVVYRLEIPSATTDLLAVSDAELAVRPVPVVSRSGEAIPALLAVPPLPGRTVDGRAFCSAEACVVVATRRDQGASGDTLLLDPTSLETVPLAFGGPVRALTTHAQASVPVDLVGGTPVVIEPGERVFALLDESPCGSSACGGALAVSTRTATAAGGFPLANDVHGQPMLPVRPSGGLGQGLALGTRLHIKVPATFSADGVVGLLKDEHPLEVGGLLTSSDGELVYFDAARLRQFDWSEATTRVTGWVLRAPEADGGAFVAPATQLQGPVLEADAGTPIQLADGSLDAQALVITWRGPVPGLTQQPSTDADGVTLPVPFAASDRARVGDTVTLVTATASCEATVTAVSTAALTIDAVPTACQSGRTAFTVRAGPDNAYIVQSTALGYLGRAPRGGSLEYTVATPVFRPDSFKATDPSLRIGFLADAPTFPNGGGPLPAGAFWTVDLASGFLPYSAVITTDSQSFEFPNCYGQVPGQVVWDNERQRVFGAFPSADRPLSGGVFELDPTLAFRGVLGNGNGVLCHR